MRRPTFRYNLASGSALRLAGALGNDDNNGVAVCRLQNVPTHRCADVLFKVNGNVKNVKIARREG